MTLKTMIEAHLAGSFRMDRVSRADTSPDPRRQLRAHKLCTRFNPKGCRLLILQIIMSAARFPSSAAAEHYEYALAYGARSYIPLQEGHSSA
jgi:hypothetical protein